MDGWMMHRHDTRFNWVPLFFPTQLITMVVVVVVVVMMVTSIPEFAPKP